MKTITRKLLVFV